MNKIKILSNIAINCTKNHKILVNNSNIIKSIYFNNILTESKSTNGLNCKSMNRWMSSSTIANQIMDENDDKEEGVLPKGFHKSKRFLPERDRRVPIAPEVSIRYMKSKGIEANNTLN